MHLDLTTTQNADRERLGACVVPGEHDPCDHKYYSCADIGCQGPYPPPRQFSDAAAPCQTIDGIPIDPAVLAGVTETRDGKPIIEIRVPCPLHCNDGMAGYLTCPRCRGKGFVVVAQATVTLLPVQTADGPPADGVVFLGSEGGLYVCHVKPSDVPGFIDNWATELRLDPLPVAGRDCVAVFRTVTP